MSRLTRDQGLVLAAKDAAETDRIVTVLTLGHGKIPILAKGARRLTRPSGAILDLLNRVEVIYYERAGLQLLREASLVHGFPGLRGDLDRLETALRGAVLVAKLLPERQANPVAFKLLLQCLAGLEQGISPKMLGLSFHLKILGAAEFRPHLSGCVACGEREDFTWCPERGGGVVPSMWRQGSGGSAPPSASANADRNARARSHWEWLIHRLGSLIHKVLPRNNSRRSGRKWSWW